MSLTPTDSRARAFAPSTMDRLYGTMDRLYGTANRLAAPADRLLRLAGPQQSHHRY
jgi:hypothetical protein